MKSSFFFNTLSYIPCTYYVIKNRDIRTELVILEGLKDHVIFTTRYSSYTWASQNSHNYIDENHISYQQFTNFLGGLHLLCIPKRVSNKFGLNRIKLQIDNA